jgi:prepilin-type N-terminal cleavage/methylation domain-containing protein
MRRGAFTLVEMLVATVIAAILMAGVLSATASLSRDRRWMETRETHAPRAAGAMELIRRDLTNGTAVVGNANDAGFALIGYGGIDAKAFVGNQRLSYVAYRVAGGVLLREQAYLDDPIRIDRWREVVATGVTRVALTPVSADGERVTLGEEVELRLRGPKNGPPMSAARLPSRVRVRIEFADGAVDREMVLR